MKYIHVCLLSQQESSVIQNMFVPLWVIWSSCYATPPTRSNMSEDLHHCTYYLSSSMGFQSDTKWYLNEDILPHLWSNCDNDRKSSVAMKKTKYIPDKG